MEESKDVILTNNLSSKINNLSSKINKFVRYEYLKVDENQPVILVNALLKSFINMCVPCINPDNYEYFINEIVDAIKSSIEIYKNEVSVNDNN